MKSRLTVKKKGLTNEEFVHELYLKQLQINRLLDITVAINNDIAAEELLQLYKTLICRELGVKKMLLFLPQGGDWRCAVHAGIPEDELEKIPTTHLSGYFLQLGNDIKKIDPTNDIFKHFTFFNFFVPVKHKDVAIAYAFFGPNNTDDFGKIQLILAITNIVAVSIENKRLLIEQINEARFDHELSLAEEIQQNLVPTNLPQFKNLEFSAVYKPHYAVGGDYYDVIALSENRTLLCVADISGKGFSAAMIMSNVQATLHAIVQYVENISDYIVLLNKALWRLMHSDRYLTLFIAEIDTDKQIIRYINSGHVPPLFIQNNIVTHLTEGTTIIGYFEDLNDISVGEISISEGSMLLIYTDGLTDVKNQSGDLISEEYLIEFARNNNNIEASAFNKQLMLEVEDFKKGLDFPDDITVLTCKFL